MSRLTPSEITVRIREADGRLLISWRGSAFDDLRHAWRQDWPHHSDCVYNGTLKAWSLPLAAERRLRQWLETHVEPEAITWQPAGHTYSSSGSAYGRYEHRGHAGSTAVAPALAEAKARLFLLPDAPQWACETMFREAIKRAHPDHGGDHAAACALTEAMELVRRHAAEKEQSA